jgi:dTDP-glucose 4,6-dehydratase
MRLLVTGCCGFIGSNFVNFYFKENKETTIVNLDAMYYCASENNIEKHIIDSDRYHLVKGNLCSFDLITHVLHSYKIDTVIHFAAQSHVQNSFDNALQYTSDNVVGTHTLLEACRKYGKIQKFIHISTDEVYGESMIEENEEKKHEGSELCPTNPYAATKAAAEMLCVAYYKSFNIPIIIIRSNNIYGNKQYIDKVIPRFIIQLLKKEKCTIQGDGSCVRSFLHIDDLIQCLELIMNEGKIGEIYNIGLGEEISILNLSKKLIKLITNSDNYEDYITFINDRDFNDKRYYISDDKIRLLGWNRKINLEDGLNSTINFYKNQLNKNN